MKLTRIVKMTFKPEHVTAFISLFEHAQPAINAMKGCHSVQLFKDLQEPHVMFTISRWDSQEDLNHYRQSDLFSHTWSETKKLFDGKPEAWSLVQPID
jgi:quinol monooxygenase YgiN